MIAPVIIGATAGAVSALAIVFAIFDGPPSVAAMIVGNGMIAVTCFALGYGLGRYERDEPRS